MHQKNSTVGIIICMVIFTLFGLFFVLRPIIGFVNFFPFFPAIFIFIFIIIIAVASTASSKQRNRIYHDYPNKFQIPLKNPYISQNSIKNDLEKEVQDSVQANYCQYCGTKIDKDAQYCHNCGTKLI